MGKTLRTTNIGTVVRQQKEKKRLPSRKFFGFTSGSHSKGVWDRDENFEQVKTDRAPIKGQDFIKYGWPFDIRHKPMREY